MEKSAKIYFLGISNELLRLVEIGENIPVKSMKNILNQGYDPIDYLEKMSDYKTYFPLPKYFNKGEAVFFKKESVDDDPKEKARKEEDDILRKQIMESIVQYYENYGHTISIEKNGLLYLSETCNRIVASDYYTDIEKNYCFFGILSPDQLIKVKNGVFVDNKEKYPKGSRKEY